MRDDSELGDYLDAFEAEVARERREEALRRAENARMVAGSLRRNIAWEIAQAEAEALAEFAEAQMAREELAAADAERRRGEVEQHALKNRKAVAELSQAQRDQEEDNRRRALVKSNAEQQAWEAERIAAKAESAAKDKPKPAATPKPKPAATPKPKPAATPKPKPAATPKPKPAATPKPKPAATPKPKPVAGRLTMDEVRLRLAGARRPTSNGPVLGNYPAGVEPKEGDIIVHVPGVGRGVIRSFALYSEAERHCRRLLASLPVGLRPSALYIDQLENGRYLPLVAVGPDDNRVYGMVALGQGEESIASVARRGGWVTSLRSLLPQKPRKSN